ncbi:MAG: hypothetical protein M1814_003234 [Vezdaea aestivalis]|nr:MAG: hypothetical protein M1814_003234 [Vezdaea aestivalis]
MTFRFPYYLLPVISACTWLGMLLAMLIVWIRQGSPHYITFNENQTIAYISDIGAQGLQPLFVAGSVVTTIFLDLSIAAERWLRHRGKLARNTTTFQKVLVGLSILFAVVGTVGLICLSIFDTLRHPSLHRLFLLFFIGGYVISAIFICWEYQRLGIHFRQHRILRHSFWVKLIFILVEIVLAIAFAVTMYKKISNTAAVLEWVISLIFTLWVVSFAMDLWPASKATQHSGLEDADGGQLENGGKEHGGVTF